MRYVADGGRDGGGAGGGGGGGSGGAEGGAGGKFPEASVHRFGASLTGYEDGADSRAYPIVCPVEREYVHSGYCSPDDLVRACG